MRKEDFSRLDTIIEWYQHLPDGHNQVEELMRARRELSTIGVRLAGYVGQLSRQSQAAEAMRKIKFNAERLKEMEAGVSVAGATAKAEADVSELRMREAEAAGRYSYGRLLYDSVNNVLNSMAGEINFLMREMATINHREN